ncbi:GerAB/ArcD/ProY family transporter [Paenibacillus sp. YIM B09110]|uniref:GerAB/ArcD/ProY family transporter n=1 Tax=Paenibacillus sp. YIM B09110 TaxID=3126102 RepID=UPI00301C74E1
MREDSWKYGDQKIDEKELMFTIGSLIIGVGILTLPRSIAKATGSPDGWLSILIAGCAVLILAWLLSRLSLRFRGRPYLEYAASIASKPAANGIAIVYASYFLMFTAYVTRSVAELSKQFLFDKTPLEVISLAFLLVLIYAVSGSRAGLIRLTVIFLPFVLIVTSIFLLLGIKQFDYHNLMPILNTDSSKVMKGAKESIFSFLGFESVLFYSCLMRNPSKIPKFTMFAIIITIITYLLIFIAVIGIFSVEVTQNILFPTLELAREVSVPGEFFERLESLFLIFWVVSIFTTAAISLDLTVQSTYFLFKAEKRKLMYGLTPVIYLLSMMPGNIVELGQLGLLVSNTGILTSLIIPVLLFVIVKIQEARSSG